MLWCSLFLEPALIVTYFNAPDSKSRAHRRAGMNRQIIQLALPSLGSLLAEPLMVLADSAMVGHLGTDQLAGLTLASSIHVFIVGMCIFLVYTTTAVAARKLGEGDQRGAIETGRDGAWLALILGTVLALALFGTAPWLLELFGASGPLAVHGVAYLRYSSWSLIGMMLVLAGTGALRGQLDTRTPFIISAAGAGANVSLNAVFIYGAGMGVAGAGLGTSIASIGMGAAFAGAIIRRARRFNISAKPDFSGILAAFASGVPLMIRTLTMHVIALSILWAVADQGSTAIAGRQIAYTTWSLTSNLLDALAIAGQALIGYELGKTASSRDRACLRACVTVLRRWGIGGGIALALIVASASPVIPYIFTADPAVIRAGMIALLVSALCQPLAGIVYMYDGILIGANDAWYLALAGLINLVVYAPALAAAWFFAPADPACALALLWGCYCGVFFLARLGTLSVRIRSDRWVGV